MSARHLFTSSLLAATLSLMSSLAQASPLLCQDVYKPAAVVASAEYDFTATYPDLANSYQQVLAHADAGSERPQLSIVIPAYREAQRLPESIKKIKSFFDQYPMNVKIHIMIEKSPDNTVEVAQKAAGDDPRFEVVDNKVQMGKGYAVRSGMKRAQGEIELFMDADLSTPLPEIFNFLNYFYQNPGAQVVIGDRESAKSQIGNKSALRKAMSATFNTLVRSVSQSKIKDTQCGFKAFRHDIGEKIFGLQTLNGFAFDVEVLALADKLGYQVSALPVQWIDDKLSTVNPFLDPIKMAFDMAKIRKLVEKNLEKNQEKPLEAQGIN